MSSPEVERALEGTRGWFVFTDPPKPVQPHDETLDSKLAHLRDLLHVEVIKADAHLEAQRVAEIRRRRHSQIPDTGGFL